jgi:hypothetical protein
MKNFQEQLPQAQLDEIYVSNILCHRMSAKLLERNDTYRWDYKLKLLNGTFTFEQKTDNICVAGYHNGKRWIKGTDTKNMAVEFTSWGKLSGISITQADYFVYWYKYLGQIWILEVSKLRQWIKENDFPIVSMGDVGSNTKGYLIPRDFFQDPFVIENF